MTFMVDAIPDRWDADMHEGTAKFDQIVARIALSRSGRENFPGDSGA